MSSEEDYLRLVDTLVEEVGERSLQWLGAQDDLPAGVEERLARARAYQAGFLDAVFAAEFEEAQPRREGEDEYEALSRHARNARRRLRKLLRLCDETEEA